MFNMPASFTAGQFAAEYAPPPRFAPNQRSSHRQSVCGVVQVPRISGVLKPQWASWVYHHRRQKDQHRGRVIKRRPDVGRAFIALDNPTLH
jgi:hypothetical protein